MVKMPEGIGALRRRFYAAPGRQTRLARPVISVGNLSMGGRGKTPVVAYLAQLLIDAGERPAILTRGYGRRRPEDGVVVVSDGVHLLADLERSGDEPLMLARLVPGARVLVCDQRALAGALAERALDATVHILDDGFQHLAVARDLDLVVVTPGDLHDRALPFGRLREPLSALAHADAIIGDGIEEEHRDVPEFRLARELGAPYALIPGEPPPAPPGPVVAVAGIAEPARFWRALEQAGWTIADRVGFPDHHRFTPSDLARIRQIAGRTGAPVVTTEKDSVRLLAMRPLQLAVSVIPLKVSIEPAAAFQRWLFDRLREVRG